MVHCDQDQVCTLSTNLETEAHARQLHEHGSAPAAGCTAARNALAVLAADSECALLEGRNYHDAMSAGQNRLRNRLIRNGHDFINHRRCRRKPLIQLALILRPGRDDTHAHRHATQNSNNLFHFDLSYRTSLR